ncbi:hypothetical protein GGS21DRAFT_216929 [Xylaria nigripes]|nr:hypothetical protein GGS21DRAFT_216929 [Xylaria nigripes]
MASDQRQRCKWDGCSCNLSFGDLYCREHRPFSGAASPTERKQLPDKHTARKSVKQSSTVEQAHPTATTSPIRKASIDLPSVDLRPAKRQRPLGLSTGLGLLPKPTSSSFSENGIPQSSKRGMFRQPEERTYKLSAIDDFALRPKKKEAVNESALNDQRQLYSKDLHSSSSRSTSSAYIFSQRYSLNEHISSRSLAVDNTGDHDIHIASGIALGQREHQKPPDGKHDLPCDKNHSVNLASSEIRLQPSQPQLGSISQNQQDRALEQDLTTLHIHKTPQNIVSNPPDVATSRPAKKITITLKKKKPDISTSNISSEPVHMDAGSVSNHQEELQPTKEQQLPDEIGRSSLDQKHSTPVHSDVGASETERIAIEKPAKSTVEALPTPEAKALAIGEDSLPPTNGTQPAAQKAELDSPVINIEHPLSARLGGREWKNMSPEERRLFWVSQHDPEELDAQIYSEHNRPFRPGDALFSNQYDALPQRPTRRATHFDYVNPATYSLHQKSEEWYRSKQKEISARNKRKANFGKAIERATQRKRAAAKLPRSQKRDNLPKRVRDNPKWLAALEVIEELSAHKRRELTQKTASVDTVPDSDADIDSS